MTRWVHVEKILPYKLHSLAIDYCQRLTFSKIAWRADENIQQPSNKKQFK